ncbi:MAG: hypothetical protein CMJ75_13810 [Planctomycetaceae bacterium]|nr:hypothetical protein [Planctomycetaceae bacterium]
MTRNKVSQSLAGNWILVLGPLFLFPAVSLAGGAEQSDDTFFERRIRPILTTRCFKCHRGRGQKPAGALALDTRAAFRRGGQSGHAIIPGQPEQSLLMQKVRAADPALRMPPDPELPLSPREIRWLAQWIRNGAPDPRETPDANAELQRLDLQQAPDFWSFQPIQPVSLPVVEPPGWGIGPVDYFLQAKWQQGGLRPVRDASRRVALRRVYFGLIGLPPTRLQLARDLRDSSADAWFRLTDRLLASPHYGERWARHWLDVVRYADSQGDPNQDFPIPQAYKYRNYVIDAFNQDKAFDLFVREQIAGDLMPARDPVEARARKIATGFLAMSRRQSGAEHLRIEDTIDTLGRSVLGLALGCARCHDHKFDPVSQRDYYALYGFFSSSRYASVVEGGPFYQRDFVPLISAAELERQVGPARQQLAALDQRLVRLRERREQVLAAPAAATQLKEIDGQLEQLEKQRAERIENWPRIDDAYAVVDGEPANARLQVRGAPGQLGPEIPRRFLEVLGGHRLLPSAKSSGRRELAGWLTGTTNPLTPRVAVNRIWQHHFGVGIVETPSDFGIRGMRPSHPRLLDFLAARFLASGWSIKSLHRLLLGARAYRLASASDEGSQARDPGNTMLWRFRRLRLDAEPLRDAMLAVSGDLDYSVGQRHPFPYQQKRWARDPFRTLYETSRRSIYVMQQKRVQRHPFLGLFDGADPNLSTARRTTSTSPLQALYFLNSEWVRKRAIGFAQRLLNEEQMLESRIDAAFEMAYGRQAAPLERQAMVVAWQALQRQVPEGTTIGRELWVWSRLAGAILSSNEFCYID